MTSKPIELDVEKYTKKGIGKIINSELLESQEINRLVEIKPQLMKAFKTNQIFRTEPEARVSVLNDTSFPTIPSKYWQSVREQMTHFTNLVYLALEVEKKQGEMNLLKAKIELLPNTKIGAAKKQIMTAEIRIIEFSFTEHKLVAKDRVREVMMWEKIKKECLKKEKFDTENVAASQMRALKERYEIEYVLGQKTNSPDLARVTRQNLDTLDRLEESGELI